MAVYVPAATWEKACDICRIVKAEDNDGYTSYLIEINVSPYTWHVSRRYKQFVEMHEKLVAKFSLDKNRIPPKKVFGNRSESFVAERRRALEFYLRELLCRFQLLPEPLQAFFDFQKYEVRAITAELSETLFNRGDELMTKEAPYTFSSLELHAITERLKLMEPTCYGDNPKRDIAHLVEFIARLKHLRITKNGDVGEDNLCFDLSFFKLLETLEVTNCSLRGLASAETLRKHLRTLEVHSSLQELAVLLLCGVVHWSPELDPPQSWPIWECVTHANLSRNFLTRIDPSVKLLSSVEHLDLSFNQIEAIENLETLSRLTKLNLCHNRISDLSSMHTRLGNVHTLDLSANGIKQLQGMSKLFSLTHLRLQNNLISSFSEVSRLSGLPCLEELNLQHNPLTFNVDYRPQLLLLFGSRAPEIEFDHLKPSEKEMDTVSVLQALKQARGEHWNAAEEVSNRYDEVAASRPDGERGPSGRRVDEPTVPNLQEASKFRRQMEALREVGGSDWLRLLNEINSGKVDLADSVLSSERDVQLHSRPSSEKNIELWTVSAELSYPEWVLSLDAGHPELGPQLRSVLDAPAEGPDADLVWAVELVHSDGFVGEVPVCVLVRDSGLVLLRVRNFAARVPELAYRRAIPASDVASLDVGPCDAYVDVRLGTRESLTLLCTHPGVARELVRHVRRRCGAASSQKTHPFLNRALSFRGIHSSTPGLGASVQNQILFGQRVLTSKALHKCHYGILHYVFVTPSHVVVVEERLHVPQVVGLDTTAQPQFHVCTLVNVHTNIEQIHLKDIDGSAPPNGTNSGAQTNRTPNRDALLENKHLEVLYRSGSWLIVEFESGVLLHLNFFNITQRNEFMDAFLCARSQKC